MLHYIHWNVSPEIFSIGPITIRCYGLFFMFSFLFGFMIMERMFKNEGKKIEDLDRLSIYVGLGTLLGARLGHCLFYQPEYYLPNPIEIFKVWEGGLASHGALVGITLAIWLFYRKHKHLSFFWTIDRVAVVVALAACFIRLGNLMNSEIFGYSTDMPWAFIFERYQGDPFPIPRHPTQIYESLSYLTIFFFLMYLYWKQNAGEYQGRLLGWFLVLLFGVRIVLEQFKENQVSFEDGLSLNMGQMLSIPAVLIGLFLLYRSYAQAPNKTYSTNNE